jgi:hypothetical protein
MKVKPEPHLKSFLKDYEAEEYRCGGRVRYRQTGGALYHSDEELKEEIDLHQFASKDELHYLLSTKGLRECYPKEVAEMRERKAIEKVEEQKRRAAEREFYREESRKRREAAMREAELEAKATISVNTEQKAGIEL